MSKISFVLIILTGAFMINHTSYASSDDSFTKSHQCLVYLESENWKLIRDDLPEIFKKENDPVELALAEGDVFTDFLIKKVGEELAELSNAATQVEAEEEMADLMEVVLSLQKHLGLDPEVVEQVRLKKRAKKGGFERGVLMKLPSKN